MQLKKLFMKEKSMYFAGGDAVLHRISFLLWMKQFVKALCKGPHFRARERSPWYSAVFVQLKLHSGFSLVALFPLFFLRILLSCSLDSVLPRTKSFSNIFICQMD